MKKIFTLVIVICAIYTANAGNGDNDSKFTLGVSVGAAMPMSSFGSTDTTGGKSALALRGNSKDSTEAIGYAKTGFHFDITAGYLFAGNIGGMVYIGGNMNSFDAATMQTQYKVVSPATITSTSYYVGQYLVGPYLSLPAGDKLKVDIRVLVGLATCNTTTTTYNDGQSGFSAQTGVYSGKGGSGFGYQLGAGIKYNLSDKMGLTFNVAYTGASISYTGYTSESTSALGSYTQTNTTLKSTMSTGLLTTTIGIAFNL